MMELTKEIDSNPLSISPNNCRIYLGGLPTTKTKNEIWQQLASLYKITNIVDVITYRDYSNPAHNRGFVFLEFRTHEEASYFRAKYGPDKLYLFDKRLIVNWANPIPEHGIVINQSKIIYLRNLNVTLASEEFASNIYKLINRENVQKVYKFKNYAFIHLNTRQNAEMLLKTLSRIYKDTVVEVSWAKPPNKFSERSFRDKTLISRRSKAYNDVCFDHQLTGHSSAKSKSPTCFRPQLSGLSSSLSHSNSPHLLPRSSSTMTSPHSAAAPNSQISQHTRFLESGNRQTDLFTPNMFASSDCGTSFDCCWPSCSCCPSTSFAVNNQSWNGTCKNVGMPHLPQTLSLLSLSQSHLPEYTLPVYDQAPRPILNRPDFSTPLNVTGFRTSAPSSLCDFTTRTTETSRNREITLQDMEAMVNNLLIED